MHVGDGAAGQARRKGLVVVARRDVGIQGVHLDGLAGTVLVGHFGLQGKAADSLIGEVPHFQLQVGITRLSVAGHLDRLDENRAARLPAGAPLGSVAVGPEDNFEVRHGALLDGGELVAGVLRCRGRGGRGAAVGQRGGVEPQHDGGGEDADHPQHAGVVSVEALLLGGIDEEADGEQGYEKRDDQDKEEESHDSCGWSVHSNPSFSVGCSRAEKVCGRRRAGALRMA